MAAAETSITTTRIGADGRLISLAGEIGPWDALLLDEELLDASDEGASTIVADLSQATSLDPVAVRVLTEASRRLSAAGGQLLVATRDDSQLGYNLRSLDGSEARQSQVVICPQSRAASRGSGPRGGS